MDEPLDPQLLVDTSTPPDVMNDPQYDTSAATGEDGQNEADNCRICRGEGSDAEPLFYPCKCSGSIKHVHQDCLMEWLSHSQKKHCELCKTPFRFTKLYSPNMPPSLPTKVFVRHFAVHSARNFATWMRFCLVVMVWLGILPYIIRQVWRVLFWFSDGGGSSARYLPDDAYLNSTTANALKMALASIPPNGTSPVNPFTAVQTNPATLGGFLEKLFDFFMPAASMVNISGADPLAASLFKTLFYGPGISGVVIPEGSVSNTSVSQFIMGVSPPNRTPSLLSEIKFLKNLTRHPFVNGIIISIAEGYIITILVVVSFILVFLIREWVVQQQPGINMGAGFNAEFAPADRARDQAAQANIDGEIPAARLIEAREVGQRPIARPRRRNPNRAEDDALLRIGNVDRPRARDELRHDRPAPVRDALTPAADIQRQLTEEPRMTEEFLAIWRRADSDPQEVLRIIERENKGDELRYWVNAMKILQTPSTRNISEASSKADTTKAQNGSEHSSASGESWVDIPKPLEVHTKSTEFPQDLDFDTDGESSLSKGKGKANEEEEPLFDPSCQGLPGMTFPELVKAHTSVFPFEPPSPEASKPDSSRLRSSSDGPSARSSISLPGLPIDRQMDSLPQSEESATPNEAESNSIADAEDTSTQVFGGESAATFKGTFDFPPNPFNPFTEAKDSAWKAKQDLRVQEAIARSREALEASQVNFKQERPAVVDKPNADSGPSPDHEGPVQVHGLDGTVRTAASMEDFLEDNPLTPDSSDESEDTPQNAEPNPFAPDVPLPDTREPIAARPVEPQGVLENIADWLWGGAVQQDVGANDEHIVEDLAAEAPFVPVAPRAEPIEPAPEQDMEVVEAAIAAGLDPNDPDAMDDAEDFEGFMELIGMRGPIFSLIQNALFSAFLLALTVSIGIWLPYNIGRVSLLLLANLGPAIKLSLRLVFSCAALIQDFVVSVLGFISYCLIGVVSLPLKIWYSASGSSIPVPATWSSTSLRISYEALDRIMNGTVSSILNVAESEMFAFSAASHESLLIVKWLIIDTVEEIGRTVIFLFTGDYTVNSAGVRIFTFELLKSGWAILLALLSFLSKRDSWVISLEVEKRAAPLDLELSVWDGMDRFWATLAGYTALGFVGALYVRKGSPFSTGPKGREWEASIIDLLNQAGGVMKVILIISIEMLVFPLYCGLLLDAALLPIFEDATIMSRILFTFESPLTSIFVHWFVGTCYMFHFALFVSMCRKIMRKGVLYFIRDPDDPTFHPVRDVLERNVTTQLRKILFSALVYGALVVICLGGVVWGLAFAFNNVLPIHWSSNEPVLEFPIDLLFYNFLMPLAVKFFKPSDGLHSMYKWWFQQCARMLRLTWFMFDERKVDEEGHIVRKSWQDLFRNPDSLSLQLVDDDQPSTEEDGSMIELFIRKDGRYVRAPASDQVRIPKGSPIFLEVDEHNKRIDGNLDRETGVHGCKNDLYKQVYIPPHFRLRICAFIISVWLFAALTGVSITIVPLVFGRHVFSRLIPNHVRKNDVYAFSIGVYILGSALYLLLHVRHLLTYLKTTLSLTADTPAALTRRLKIFFLRAISIIWTYSAFVFLLPTLFAFLLEFYAILPLHTYFSPTEPHTIHFVQTWTLGLLYVKLTTRLILFYPDSRPAISLNNILRDGYLNPDARLATRSFILPTTLFLSAALVWPWALARLAVATVLPAVSDEQRTLVFRYIYPAVLATAVVAYLLCLLALGVRGWRMRIRDEVYLIGERLHNFREKKADAGSGNEGVRAGLRRIET